MNLIADTGLLMALLNQCDAHHDEAEAMVDHRDFSIYRLFGQQVVPIVCPA
jgi:predicted nucleic acid-binding protein